MRSPTNPLPREATVTGENNEYLFCKFLGIVIKAYRK